MPRKIANKTNIAFIISVIFITLIIVFLFFYAIDNAKITGKVQEIPSCGDGTHYGTCSKTKPYFCDAGILIEKASVCGCVSFSEPRDDSCYSKYHAYQENRILKYIDNSVEKEIEFAVYGEMADYVSKVSRVIEYKENEKPSRRDFKIKTINNEEQQEFLMPLVVKIQNLENDKVQQARIAVSLVQNIPYGSAEKTVSFAGSEVSYSVYPYEVLYYDKGICGEKSTLLAFLLKEMGYGVSIFYFPEENHEAVGIKCPIEKSFHETGYCFVETSGPAIISDSSIEYVGDVKLASEPEVIVISNGISLPENMQEYKDAKTLKKIREGGVGSFFIFNKNGKFEALKKKYGLIEDYGLE